MAGRKPTRGRGAVSNVPGRFQRHEVVDFDDGWGSLDLELPPSKTTLTPEPARTIITRNQSPDVPFDQSINPYKGCEHGCIYCFARPSHAYLDLSPGLDFETRLFSKPQAPELLRRELRRPGYHCRPIALGVNTDPYQPVEREQRITRRLLEVLAEHRHPVCLITKSALVLRDLDLLGPMARDGLVSVYVSVTTLDLQLASKLEPRAPIPERRLEAIHGLDEAGVSSGVMAAPMIPGINDWELERILEAAARSGARSASYILLRLPNEVKQLFADWLRAHYPDRADKVLRRLREMRGGRLNDPRFGSRMRGTGPHADLLACRFDVARRRWGLDGDRPKLRTDLFRLPPAPGDQMRLFG